MWNVELTTEHEQILRDQVIDAEHPGPILHDFDVLLEYVGTDGVRAAGKYNLLPIDAIPILDERLSRPLRLKLTRPQLRSHPYLQGLHLLLRGSGLTRIVGTGSKARLVVDPAMLERWQNLNSTEQYFALLEAWLRHCRAEMIGERFGWSGEFGTDCLRYWKNLAVWAKKYAASIPQHFYMASLGPNFCLLALFDLFGLMTVGHTEFPVQPWRPASVHPSPIGDAICTLLWKWRFAPRDGDDENGECNDKLADLYLCAATANDQSEQRDSFGVWQPIFAPYFPEWRENLVVPHAESTDGVYVFHVSLPRMWRQIAIPADLTLNHLAHAILNSVDFDDDHLYEFNYRDALGRTVHVAHPETDEGPWTDQVKIGELQLQPGQSMTFLFDYGDAWKFDVKLEKIEPRNPCMKQPRVVAKQGDAPQQYPDWEA